MGVFGGLLELGGNALGGLLGLALDVFGGILIAVISLLPTWSLSDFLPDDGLAGSDGAFDAVMGWVNWFIPFGPITALLLGWFAVVLAVKATMLVKAILENSK